MKFIETLLAYTLLSSPILGSDMWINESVSTGVCIKRVVESKGYSLRGKGGNDSFIEKRSYMAVRTYLVEGIGAGSRKAFVEKLVKVHSEEAGKLGFIVQSSHSDDYSEGLCAGRVSLISPKGVPLAQSAMIDVRLFGRDQNSCFVNITLHLTYLADPDKVPDPSKAAKDAVSDPASTKKD